MGKAKLNTDDISLTEVESVLGAITHGIHKDTVLALDGLDVKHPMSDRIKAAVESIQNNDLEKFYYSWLYPYSKLTDGLLQKVLPEHNDAHFLLKHYDFLNAHFKMVIMHKDGMACCADKSRTILHRLLRYFVDGTHIEFNGDDQYVFAYPVHVFTTHDDIIEFFDALRGMYYGAAGLYDSLKGKYRT